MDLRIIDAHNHVFPQKIADKASVSIGNFYDIPSFCAATIDNLKLNGDKNGVEKFLICSTSMTPHQTVGINDFMAAMNEDERFIALGTTNPDDENWREEIERVKSLGLYGIKLHSDMQKFDIDDSRMIERYRYMRDLGLPVLFHMGDKRYDSSAPFRLANVLREIPDLVCIAAHMGGYSRWDEAYSVLPVLDNLYFDTSSALGLMSNEQALRMIEKHGEDRFVFGSDYPLWDPKWALDSFLGLGLGETANRKILAENFCKLFNIE